MNEAQLPFPIGPLMKAARKFKKLNQADVAQAIGCSQSALSKMEHNLLIPSAPQWYLFARFTSIPLETIATGVIDRKSKVKFNNDQISLGFKIPKKYRNFRAEKVREIYPFLEFLEKKMIPPMHKEFIDSTGLDPEFFLDFDNLISFELFVDIVKYFIHLRKNSPRDIKGIVNFGQNDVYWDHFTVDWEKLHTVETVLWAFAQEQIFFQGDFQIKVETISGKTFISYYPEYHMKQTGTSATPEVIEFLNHYREATLEHLIERTLGKKLRVKWVPEVSSTALGARFEVAAA
jgi:transcriptional regulator with XRE-family HTH domain